MADSNPGTGVAKRPPLAVLRLDAVIAKLPPPAAWLLAASSLPAASAGTRHTSPARPLWTAVFLLAASASGLGAENGGGSLVTDFWMAATPEEQNAGEQALLAAVEGVPELYAWLKQGPVFPPDVETGAWEGERVGADGLTFRYGVVVPDSYDPQVSYPVEFMLHGGVARPEWGPGGEWWRSGYANLQREDRIFVVPAAWRDAFWWHDNQADSLPAVLREVKRRYNVDDNRVSMTGISDGGTGAYFFAFKQPSEWASFLPYIGHPGVLRNPAGGAGYRLYFENLTAKPLYIVNGELDRLYPAASLRSFIDVLIEAEVEHVFREIEGGGHDTRWLPDETPAIERFKAEHPRDPFPESLQWVADRDDRYNRNMWLRIDQMASADFPAVAKVERDGNRFTVEATAVAGFSLLLSPEEVDFSKPITVFVNGEMVYEDLVGQSAETLLRWARETLDRQALITAELTISLLAD